MPLPLTTLVLTATAAAAAPPIAWQPLAPGLDHALVAPRPDTRDAGPLEVVRADPRRIRADVVTIAEQGGDPRTAAQWADARGGAVQVVTNAGMFATDHSTHTGYLAAHGRVLSAQWVKSYQSVLAFDPARAGVPLMRVLDLDVPADKAAMSDYRGLAQNLRLIGAPALNKWKKNGKLWSEAALAQDRRGHVLIVFARSPHSMVDFNERLIAQLDVVSAQHLEGGPEASLTIRAPELRVDRAGSFETGFFDDSNQHQWPLPNVLVLEPLPPADRHR